MTTHKWSERLGREVNLLEQQIEALHDLAEAHNGESHYDLAQRIENDLSLAVDMDPENNERSEIKLSGCWHEDGTDIVIGEIRGDAVANIVFDN